MDRVAVFVDAGYLFAQASTLLSGAKLPRSKVKLNHEEVAKALAEFAERVSGLKLLRIYWYDGTSTGPNSQHIALAYLPKVKLRLGFVNSVGEQKGVDSLIITDMIALARNRAVSEMILISGDEDLRVGVQQAQEFGVCVHLVGIKPSRGSQSLFLLQEADATYEWDADEIKSFLSCESPAPTTAIPAVTAPTALKDPLEALAGVARLIAGSVDETQLVALIASIKATGQTPQDLDAKILGRGRATIGRDLTGGDKRYVRQAFIAECEARSVALAPKPATSKIIKKN